MLVEMVDLYGIIGLKIVWIVCKGLSVVLVSVGKELRREYNLTRKTT